MIDLSDQELLRYSRQILLAEVDVQGQAALKASRVLIVGLGGLGSPVALYLAAAGIGTLHLADFDRVDESNLQRQVMHDSAAIGLSKVDSALARLRALNPLIQLHGITQALDDEYLATLLPECDLVLDCSDNFLTREAVNRACLEARVPLVSGAAIRWQGQVSVFDFKDRQSPCYHCLYGEGADEELTCSQAGVMGPVVGMIGSLQALEAIKLVTGVGHALQGRLLILDALKARFRESRIHKDPDCAVCGDGQ